MKTLEEFRNHYLRLMRQLCPEDPEYVDKWIRMFDEQHGLRLRPSNRLRLLNEGIRKKARTKTEKSVGTKSSGSPL